VSGSYGVTHISRARTCNARAALCLLIASAHRSAHHVSGPAHLLSSELPETVFIHVYFVLTLIGLHCREYTVR
jgi:hypothetical protein